MTRAARRFGCERRGPAWRILLGACGIAGCVAAPAPARAEDDAVAESSVPDVAATRDQASVDLGENFDRNVFHHPEGFGWTTVASRQAGARPPAAPPEESLAPAVMRKVTAARLASLDAVCGLSAEQRRTLQLAIEADASRATALIEAERNKCVGVVVDLRHPEGQQRLQAFQRDVQRCRDLIRHPFDAGSLFASALPTTLDADQQARLVAEEEARRAFLWRTLVTGAMLRLDASLGLGQRQFEELETLLLERRPPLRIAGFASQHSIHLRVFLPLMVLADIDRERLGAIVNERQLSLLITQATNAQGMRQVCEHHGLLEARPR